jgi:autotransporter adhesin
VAIGAGARANADPSTAVGAQANAAGANSVALGAGAQATGSNSVALGAGSTDSGQADVVSVGSASQQRRITNVAPGIAPTDAATMGQLNAVSGRLDSVAAALKKRINQTGAIAMAALQIALPPGYTQGVGVGMGSQGGQAAIAIGLIKDPRPWLQVRFTAGYAGAVSSFGGGVSIGW